MMWPMTYTIEGTTRRRIDTNGVTLTVHEVGEPNDRPTVVLCHGFPEVAHAWRYQLRALDEAGFHAIAPDQRGYADSSSPDAVEDYDIHQLTGDLVGLLDHYGVERGVFAGHDWGGFVVWQMPLLHPDRTAGVIGLNTPYYPRFPMPPTEIFAMADPNHYIIQFQERGGPDAKLADRVDEVFRHMFRRAMPIDEIDALAAQGGDADFVDRVCGAPLMGEPLLSDAELEERVEAFRESGFTGPLNWYRNFDRNWETTADQGDSARIEVPSLMITAAWDPILRPALAEPMRAFVPDLEMHQIEECGHWTQQEHPDQVNAIVIDWLTRRFASPPTSRK